jgi:protein gp37
VAEHSKIQWTEATWSPTVGCTHVSAGCDHCYAATLASGRLKHLPEYEGLAEHGKFNGTVRLLEDRLQLPLKWRKPRMIFVDSMSDLFHESVPDGYIARVWEVMAHPSQHTFQILTKRHGRMRSWLQRWHNTTGDDQVSTIAMPRGPHAIRAVPLGAAVRRHARHHGRTP